MDGMLLSGGAWKLDAQLQEGNALTSRLAGGRRWQQLKTAV